MLIMLRIQVTVRKSDADATTSTSMNCVERALYRVALRRFRWISSVGVTSTSADLSDIDGVRYRCDFSESVGERINDAVYGMCAYPVTFTFRFENENARS